MILSGCHTPLQITDTPRFYSSTSDNFRVPKPDDYPVQILLYPPKRRYKVIGNFTMRSKNYDYDFMTEAARYNACRAGADAVLVLEQAQVPSHFVLHHPWAAAHEGDEPEPGDWERNYFDAEMIVYK